MLLHGGCLLKFHSRLPKLSHVKNPPPPPPPLGATCFPSCSDLGHVVVSAHLNVRAGGNGTWPLNQFQLRVSDKEAGSRAGVNTVTRLLARPLLLGIKKNGRMHLLLNMTTFTLSLHRSSFTHFTQTLCACEFSFTVCSYAAGVVLVVFSISLEKWELAFKECRKKTEVFLLIRNTFHSRADVSEGSTLRHNYPKYAKTKFAKEVQRSHEGHDEQRSDARSHRILLNVLKSKLYVNPVF